MLLVCLEVGEWLIEVVDTVGISVGFEDVWLGLTDVAKVRSVAKGVGVTEVI